VHTPVWHVSVCVHALPSLHVVPFEAVGFEQEPVDGLHVPTVWHWSLAVHVTGFDPVHTPVWQVSVCVHALPSLHVVPFETVGLEQVPVDGLHVPATWHWSLARHVTGFDPVHTPAAQAYVWSQRFVPVHDVPSVTVGLEQVPVDGLQLPAVWHWSLAVHVTGFDPVHTPLSHAYVWSQRSVPAHEVPFATVGLEHVPVDGLQVPAVWH